VTEEQRKLIVLEEGAMPRDTIVDIGFGSMRAEDALWQHPHEFFVWAAEQDAPALWDGWLDDIASAMGYIDFDGDGQYD
jgi:hypothetical protein